MKVDIWSDVRCPFCYIGKRKFEMALERFPHRDKVEVVWHSFQLDPGMETRADTKASDYLAARKGVSSGQAEEMHRQVAGIAGEIGLQFDFEHMVVANSFNAHRLIQLARSRGAAGAAEETLFRAFFCEGKNIDDTETLVRAGVAAGLQEKDIRDMLSSGDFAAEVKQDDLAARSIGIRGVPFFIFNNRYAVSGAQSPDVFLETLQRSWQEFEADGLVVTEGNACAADGDCNKL